MLPELIRALPAAIVVCLLPGYFWARLLCAAEDFPARLAYSIALSITLVPAVALAQIRLFGTGLTFTVAVVSLLVVFVTGLVAYLGLGIKKESERPLLSQPAPPGTPALGLFALAFMAALVGLVGLVPDWLGWLATAALLLSGASTYLLTDYRGTAPSDEEVAEAYPDTSFGPLVRYTLLGVILALVLLRGYLGPVFKDWPYLRGDDQYQHTVMTKLMISEGSTGSFMLYPPGIHLSMAELTHVSGLEPLSIFATLVPILLVPPTLALYTLGRRLWGWEYGLAAAAFYGLLIGGSYWYLDHGRYPNLIAAQFLMVLALATLFRLYNSPSWRSGVLLALLGSSVVLYHQVGSLYLAFLLAIVTVLFLPYSLLQERRSGLALVASLGFLGVLSVLYAWNTYDLPRLVRNALGDDASGRGGEAVEMAIGTKPPESLGRIIDMTSEPVLWLGLLGALLLLFYRERRAGAPDTLVRAVLLVWSVMMFVGSLTTMSGFPDRFQRDLGVPLALLAALAFITILRSVAVRRGTAALIVASITVLAAGTLVEYRAMKSLILASESSSQLTMSPQVAAAGEWLAEHNEGGNIVVTPYVDFVPSRGLLALGGYTGMQSYDAPRIRRGRDIPPAGPEPMWDALWLLENPTGEETLRLLDEYDVRYLVLSKRFPSWDPVPFEQSGLYRKVFDNGAVVIFEPEYKAPGNP